MKVSLERVIESIENDEIAGFCMACGEEHRVEPDARNYECDACGEMKVFGNEEILMFFF